MSSPNPFAQIGCAEPATNYIQWDIVYYILTGFFFAYSLPQFMAPLDIQLFKQNPVKYMYMSWTAGMSEDKQGEYEDFGIIASVQAHFAGSLFVVFGLFTLWASETRDDLTFFHAIVIGYAVVLACWVYVYLKFRESWKPMIFAWALQFLVGLILAIVVLVNNDSDAKQFGETEDGLKAGVVLWILVAIQALGAVQIGIASVSPQFNKILVDMHLKDGEEATNLSVFLTRWNAILQINLLLIFLWAALAIENNDETEHDFTFQMALWIPLAAIIAVILYTNAREEYEGLQTSYHAAFSSVLITAVFSVTFITWYLGCHDGELAN